MSQDSTELQQMQQIQQLSLIMNSPNFNPSVLIQTDFFPDAFQYLSSEQSKQLIEQLTLPAYSNLVNKQGPLGGYTPLHWMCIKNELESVEFLLEKCKADVNCKANLGETPLFICIKNCNLYSIEVLIKYGADLNHRDVYNRSLVHWAAYTGKVILLYYFQKYYSINNLNDIDQFQQNALHIACASGYSDLIMYLINRGEIDYFSKDFNGNTCLHMAAKSGLARICWILTQQNKGECAKLISVVNNQNQTPFDLIRNDRGAQFKKIKDWLRLEAKTNPKLMKNNNKDFFEKKNDNYSDTSLLKIKKGTRCINWNSHMKLKFEYTIRYLSFFLVITIPLLINKFILYPNDMGICKGLVGYSTFIGILIVVSKQKHRINHISGDENPYFLGFLFSLFIHNYIAFYFYIFGKFNYINLFDLVTILLSIWHVFTFYKAVTTDPGFCKESFKKPDGTPYEIRDLMKLNARDLKFGKDSINWLTEPPSLGQINKPIELPQLYFCESCIIIQTLPTKHCKLCEACCSKFDHHCLFINKCVGVKNHKAFIVFLLCTFICVNIFLYSIYSYFVEFNTKLNETNKGKSEYEQIDLLYVIFASTDHIWFVVLALVNGFTNLMVLFLFSFQLKFITLGYTSQFRPPIYFVKTNKRMSSLIDGLKHRFENLYVFLFESCEMNQELYFRQQKEYSIAISGDKLSLFPDPYPRDNFSKNKFNNDLPNSFNDNNNQFEIDLD